MLGKLLRVVSVAASFEQDAFGADLDRQIGDSSARLVLHGPFDQGGQLLGLLQVSGRTPTNPSIAFMRDCRSSMALSSFAAGKPFPYTGDNGWRTKERPCSRQVIKTIMAY